MVPAEFFALLELPVKEGRALARDSASTDAVVSETLARRFWPDGHAAGHVVRRTDTGDTFQIVGVVGDIRLNSPTSEQRIQDSRLYTLEPASLTPAPLPPVTTWRTLNFTLRMDSSKPATAVLAAARAVDPRLVVLFETVDERYSVWTANATLATRVMSAFGVLALMVALLGVYGVMSYLVAGRAREIGIRMALGAEPRNIRRLVMTSAMRMVVIGAVLGTGAAFVAAHWVSTQLFGVSANDPIVYVLVSGIVIATAALATWRPAHQAAMIDPVRTMRSE
jgi:hypothetical protein